MNILFLLLFLIYLLWFLVCVYLEIKQFQRFKEPQGDAGSEMVEIEIKSFKLLEFAQVD